MKVTLLTVYPSDTRSAIRSYFGRNGTPNAQGGGVGRRGFHSAGRGALFSPITLKSSNSPLFVTRAEVLLVKTVHHFVVLDCGLQVVGTTLHPKLWSAGCVLSEEGRCAIAQVHKEFLDAGANIITTVSYQATKEGFLAACSFPELVVGETMSYSCEHFRTLCRPNEDCRLHSTFLNSCTFQKGLFSKRVHGGLP
jgi:hypothetical protein